MIPIYRAKKIDSEEYVEGYLEPSFDKNMCECWAIRTTTQRNPHYWGQDLYEIDPTTLAIHFPDMLDSEGNKIFASLSEDGKGGDRLVEVGKYDDGFNPIFEPYFRKSSLSIFDLPQTPYGEYKLYNYKIVGIQQ